MNEQTTAVGTDLPAARVDTFFPIVATVWRNKNTSGDYWYSTVIVRKYKDGQGNWRDSGSFGADDLLVVMKVADIAHTTIAQLRRTYQSNQRQAAEAQDEQRTPGQEG